MRVNPASASTKGTADIGLSNPIERSSILKIVTKNVVDEMLKATE